MKFTPENLAALEEAMANGVRAVTFPDGSRTEYRSLTDMRDLRNMMIRSLSTPEDRVSQAAFRRRS